MSPTIVLKKALNVALQGIEAKWGEAAANYIKGCNSSDEYAKAI